MMVQIHTPKGVFTIDTDTVTSKRLSELGITRDNLSNLLAEQYSPNAEMKRLEARIVELEKLQGG